MTIAVLDALLQRVRVDRLSEVLRVGDVLSFLRGRREADLRRAAEVGQDFPPSRVLVGTAAMALVHDHQIEEVGGELLVYVLLFLGP